MSNQNKRINVVGPLIIVLAIVIYAFSKGFWEGVNLLGEIVNIFGTLFVWVIGFIWDIPIIRQKIIKNCITTIIIIVIFGTSLSKAENKVASIIIGGGVSLVCAILAWCNLI